MRRRGHVPEIRNALTGGAGLDAGEDCKLDAECKSKIDVQ